MNADTQYKKAFLNCEKKDGRTREQNEIAVTNFHGRPNTHFSYV